MVLKKIAAICKAAGQIIILEDERRECQWVGTWKAQYPLDGYPVVDESTVFALLDIPEKDREKFQVYHKHAIRPEIYADSGVTEHLAAETKLQIVYGSQVLIPAADTQGGICFYDPDMLKPLNDLRKQLDLYIRYNGKGDKVIAVKSGLLLQALFLPEEVEKDSLWEALADIGTRMRQAEIKVDPETGEVMEE